MKIWIKVLSGIALSFMCLFVCVGYASVTEQLIVVGEVEAVPPKAVFITTITTDGTNGGNATVNSYSLTVVNSMVNLSQNKKGTAKFTVTVYNNTDVTQGYNAMIYTLGEETYDNENIVVTPQIERRTAVEPNEYLTFEITVEYKDASKITDTVLNSVITYEFLPLDDIPEDEGEIAVSGVLEQFRKILNNEVTGRPLSYSELIGQMNQYSANDRNDSSYIGNVDGASNNDIALLDGLFQGQLNLNINGTDTPVTVLIKNEEVDGNTANGNEMTIYMTTDDLQKTSSGWFSPTEYAPVYAAVFRKETLEDGTEKWSQIGDMYLGSAEIKRYDGWPGSGSFDTDNWRLLNESGQRTSTTIKNIVQNLD